MASFIQGHNVFDGTVESVDDGIARVVTPLGAFVVHTLADVASPPGTGVSFSVRAELLSPVVEGAHVNRFEAECRAVEFLGSVRRYDLRAADGRSVRLEQFGSAARRIAEGTKLIVGWRVEDGVLHAPGGGSG